MAISPRESLVTFILSGASSTVYADEVQYAFITDPFDRLEFSNDKLRSAKTSTGASPIIVTTFGGLPVQIGVVCTGDSPRPLTPDDANATNIKQRFNVDRFTIQGGISLATELAEIRTIAEDHQKRLAKFNYHISKAGLDISYTALVAMQSENFSYLTSTGLTIVGPAIGVGTNMLISSFTTDVAFEVTQPGGGSLVLQRWSMVVEHRTISSLGA